MGAPNRRICAAMARTSSLSTKESPFGRNPFEEFGLALRSPSGSAAVLDVVNSHRIRKHFLAGAAIVCGEAEERIQVHREQIHFRVPPQVEPMLARDKVKSPQALVCRKSGEFGGGSSGEPRPDRAAPRRDRLARPLRG